MIRSIRISVANALQWLAGVIRPLDGGGPPTPPDVAPPPKQ